MSAVEFRQVSKIYEYDEIGLENISFSIEKGEFVFIIGRSGAGKSTLIKLMSNQIEPTSGKIFINDIDISAIKNSQKPFFHRQIGIMQPDLDLIEDKTVYENIALSMRALQVPKKIAKQRIEQTLKTMGVANIMNSYPKSISKGETARVMLARAMIKNPSILIADEPTANLDADTAWDIMCLLEDFNRIGVTVIVVSHNRELVSIMRKRVLTFTAGRLVADEKNARYNSYASDIIEERRILNEREGRQTDR